MLNADLHSRPTRIVRRQHDPLDDRQTLVCDVGRGPVCRTCRAALDDDSQFCGMCGERVRARASLVGTVIDDLYAIEHHLADGATASIYQARYLPSGHEVALKVLHPELAFDPIATERFRREARCLTRLRDPGTVVVFDHGETNDGTLYIAMELLRGDGLDVRVRTRGAMPWRRALSILRAVCGSLGEAHGLGIVHRDLKPANIRLGANDAVKVIDFGVAKLRRDADDEELTQAGHAVGTLQYMAPEQLAGQTCDARADLYALGVIGLELLVGRARIPGAPAAVLPAEIPRAVEAILLRCLASRPDDRFASAAELARALDSVLTEAPVAAAPKPRRVFAHTSAFELQPPRVVIDAIPVPAFLARGSEHDLLIPGRTSSRWRLWVLALAACGVGLGVAVSGCV